MQFKFGEKVLCSGVTNGSGIYGCLLSGIQVTDKLTVEVVDENY